MIKKWIQRCFAVVVLLVLLLGLGKTLLRPKDVNTYENRYANKVSPFTVAGFRDATFQDSLEDALMDQVPGAQTLKKLRHQASSAYLQTLMDPFLAAHPDRYVRYLGAELFGGYMTYAPLSLEEYGPKLQVRAENINTALSLHSDVPFFLYLIERDTDVNFETGEKVPFYDLLTEQIVLPAHRMARFRVDSFRDYAPYFYRTDHHWNYKGSYEGYTKVLDLLGCGDAPLEPLEEITLSLPYAGAKAVTAGALTQTESFTAYRFDFPAMDISINGEPAQDYGAQDAFLDGTVTGLSYGAFYGPDAGEAIFDTDRPHRENLLILGDSFDNAILKLLASHYNRTYAVDLRNYKALLGRDFSLTNYLDENQIDRVLLIGSEKFFTEQDFFMEQ